MEEALRASVHESLAVYVFPNAILLAGALLAEYPTLENLRLLAHCHMAASEPAAAYRLLRAHLPFDGMPAATVGTGGARPHLFDCRFLYGVAAASLGRWGECEQALLPLSPHGHAGVSHWLGVCAQRQENPQAATHFARSHALDPANYSALECACALTGGVPHGNPYTAITATFDREQRGGGADAGRCDLMRYLGRRAEATLKVAAFQCDAALQSIASDAQDGSWGWDRAQAAVAAFHKGDNALAASLFRALFDREPWRVAMPATVLYSTALWHLKRQSELAALTQSLIELEPESAVTLAVAGNCYSLAKDAKTALAMFTRATQADPTLSYAHTLRGHECLALQQPTDAEDAFRAALRCDPRQYSALAGLGDLHFRDENDGPARVYLQSALDINLLPGIANRLAMTYHRPGASRSDLLKAVAIYDLALHRAPDNLVARHQRASVLLRLGQTPEALQALRALAASHPDEAQVHLSLGRALALSGLIPDAVGAFSQAAQLDPRRAGMAKMYTDRLASGTFEEDD